MWAGVQKVSRPIERCHEMSQRMPTLALVAAMTAAHTNQGTPTAPRGAGGAAARAAGPAGVVMVVFVTS